MEKINVIVIEDDELTRLDMVKMLKAFDFINVTYHTGNSEDAEAYLTMNKIDLIISDIRLPDDKNTIFHILDRLLDKDVRLPYVILFSSSSIAYQEKALNNQAVVLGSLNKGVDNEKLGAVLNKAKGILDKQPYAVNKRPLTMDDYIFVRYKGGKAKQPGQWFLRVGDIKYIESDGANVKIQFSKRIQKAHISYGVGGIPETNGNYFLHSDETARYFSSMGALQERLDARYFIKVNPSFLVNIQFIETIDVQDQQIWIHLFGGYRMDVRGEPQILNFNSYLKL